MTVLLMAIAGERKSETKSEEEGKTRSQFRYGKFALSNSSTRTHSKHQRYRRLQKRYPKLDSTQIRRREKQSSESKLI